MNKAVLLSTLFVAVFPAFPIRASAQATAAYAVADASSGHILDAANADRKLQIGSLTKIATAMVVLDWAEKTKTDLNGQITVSNAPFASGDTSADPLHASDRASMRDLLYAALMQSDNIAAFTLAEHVGATLSTGAKGASMDRFVAQMNALARHLHMDHTLFVNPHGLDSTERKLPYSTAADLVRLTQYAMARPAFRFFVSQKERRIAIDRATGGPGGYLLRNTNELIGINGIDGVKTGTTRRAGECLIISSEHPPESIKSGESYTITPRRLIVVVLGSSDRFRSAQGLLERGWQLHQNWVGAGRPAKGRL